MLCDPAKGESITYHVRSTSIPKIDIEESKVNFLSQDFVVPRQVKYDGSWKINILMDQNIKYYRVLRDWQEQFASLKLSGGGIKMIPNVEAHVGLLDGTLQNVIHRFTLVGVFPQDIPDLAMQYENNASLVDFNATLTYQYFYDNDYNDPLQASGNTNN